MYSARDIARCLILLADADGEFMSEMRLHKLLYYAQGWSLGLMHERLFTESIEAWKYGPVIPKLRNELPTQNRMLSVDVFDGATPLNKEHSEFVQLIWNRYRKHSGWNLHRLTHEERPWKDARGDLPDDARSSNQITVESLRSHFGQEGVPGLDPLRAWQAEYEADVGRVVSHEELKQKIVNN